MRSSVLDWLIQVQQYLNLSDVTLHLAVANFDEVISRVDFDKDEVQLLGLACLQLAAKVEEDCPPAPALLLPLAGGVYSKQDLARVELEVLRALDWRLRKTTSAVFLHYYSEILGKGKRVIFKLARAVLDLCLTETWYGTVQPSHLASTALLAASYLLGKGWPEELANTTGHCPTELLGKLVTVLNMVNGGQVGDGVKEKHDKSLARVKALGEESVKGIVKNAQKELEKIEDVPETVQMILV
jgi:cyclin A